MIKTFSFRIKDSNSAKHLDAMARSVNRVWNYCNQIQKDAIKWNKSKCPTGFDLSNLTSGCSKELGLHSQTVQGVCEEYATRREQFNKGKLRWRSNKKSLGWIPFKKSGIKLNGDSVTYCKHKFRFWLSRKIEGQIKSGSFSQDSRGRWYFNITCDVIPVKKECGTKAVGIDLNLKEFAVLSDGTVIEAKQFYRNAESDLAMAQRANKPKLIKTINAKIKNSRKDFHHKLSSTLVAEYAAIFVGDVSAPKLVKTKMAKSVLDAGWSAFRTILKYKSDHAGVWYQLVNEAGSTVTCSCCKKRTGPSGLEGLRIREWICIECGTHHHRDVNSAKNILRLGHQSLAVGIPAL